MLPSKLLTGTIRRSSYRFAVTGIILTSVLACQGESTNGAGKVTINTASEITDDTVQRIHRAQLNANEPLTLGFDHKNDLFPDSGILLHRRAELSYSAEQGHSQPGSVMVESRAGGWHGPLIRLPQLATGQAFRFSSWIKLDGVNPPTTARLIVSRVADGETRTLKLAEVTLTPGDWSKLEGEFISGFHVADDIVAAHINVQAPEAKYFLDDISVAYTDASEDLQVLAAGEVKPVAAHFVLNGSAEEGLEPWGSQGGAVSLSSARAHTGEYSVLITDRSKDWHAPTMDVSGLQDNIEYEFSIFVYIEDGQQPVEMKLTLKRETGGQVSFINLAVENAVESGAWVEVAGRFSSSTISRSHATTVYLESSDPSLSYYVDTLTVKEVR